MVVVAPSKPGFAIAGACRVSPSPLRNRHFPEQRSRDSRRFVADSPSGWNSIGKRLIAKLRSVGMGLGRAISQGLGSLSAQAEIEAELVARAVAGDRSALERLLLEHATSVARHVDGRLPARLRSVVSVDDLLQETFLHAFRSVAHFEARAGSTFGGWLKTIADARLADAVRREQRVKRGGRPGSEETPRQRRPSAIILAEVTSPERRPSSLTAQREAISAVQGAVASLPDAQRDAVQVHLVSGETLADTATRLGCTADAVRGLIHRAKGNLRNALGRSSRWLSKRG